MHSLLFIYRLKSGLEGWEPTKAGKQERMLLSAHKYNLPEIFVDINAPRDTCEDQTAISLLERVSPMTLHTHTPLAVQGDGNYMYRAVSLASFGTEKYHLLLRLRAAIEMVEHPTAYDSTASGYKDFIGDRRVVTPTYKELISAVVTEGSYADLHHIYAVSAVIHRTISSYFPSVGACDQRSSAYTRICKGRGVTSRKEPLCSLMWSMFQTLPTNNNGIVHFIPNHFVMLHSKSISDATMEIVDQSIEPAKSKSHPSHTVRFADDTDETRPSSPVGDFTPVVTSSPIRHTVDETDLLTPKRPVTSSSSLILDDTCPSEYRDTITDVHTDVESPASDNVLAHGNISDFETSGVSQLQSKQETDHALPSRFLTIDEVLHNITLEANHLLEKIPNGEKNNAFYIVSNRNNSERRSAGYKCDFTDDCGAWVSSKGTSPTSLFLLQNNNHLINVFRRDGKICISKQVIKKRIMIPLDPQPMDTDVICVHRYFFNSNIHVI